jgi:hypothetical protein
MDRIDTVRAEVLTRVDRAERNYRLAFFAAVALEGLFLAAFLLLANLHDRTHVLLLLATVTSYTIVVLGLMALGAHVNRTTLRVLQAIDALKPESGAK